MMRYCLSVLAAAALFGSPAFANYSYENTNTLTILTDTTNGGNATGTSTFYNGGDTSKADGSTTFTGAVLNSGDATHTAAYTWIDGNSKLNNYATNTVNINTNSTLALLTHALPDTPFGSINLPNASVAHLLNYGAVNWAGKMQFQPRNITSYSGAGAVNPNITLIDNYGAMQITGPTAAIERLPNPDGNTIYGHEVGAFLNWASLSGNGTLTYTNSTGNAALDTLILANFGTIAPGTAAAPGTLDLVNMSTYAGSGSKFAVRLGGTAAGTFDVLTLSGTGADLQSIAMPTISLVNGFVPQVGDQWQILNYDSTEGTLGTPFAVGGGYTLEYYPTYATLTLTPEPSSLVLLGMGGLLLMGRRRR